MGPVHQATSRDAGIVAALIRDSFRPVADRYLIGGAVPSHPSNCRPDWIVSDMQRGWSYFTIWSDDDPAGCVCLGPLSNEAIEMRRLAVLPRFQGRGMGRDLITHCLRTAKIMGARFLDAAVMTDNAPLVG
jgi:GNAT superfamily N-acetyltransferase